jgi:hypothetical protein
MIVVIVACSALGAGDQTTPAATVKSFAKFFQVADFESLKTLVKDGKMTQGAQDVSQRIKPGTFGISVVIEKSKITGSTATLLTVTTLTGSETKTFREDIKLEKIGPKWFIVARPQGDSDSYLNLVASLLRYDSEQKMKSGVDSDCRIQMKQVGIGIRLYLVDNDDVWSFKATNWMTKIKPYIKDVKLLTCPLDAAGTKSYTFNALLFGKSQSRIEDLEHTVMVYEGKNGKLSFRHHGLAHILSCDGHFKAVTPAEAKKLFWKP